GLEALEILQHTTWTDSNPMPHMILLDINMPQMNGREFLQHIRNDNNLSALNVFVLTTSNSPQDRNTFDQFHVSGYFNKGSQFDSLMNIVDVITDFWNNFYDSYADGENKPRKVLLVEDDNVVRSSTAKCLKLAGYQTIQSINGIDALEILKFFLPDLIITDLYMPLMDGLSLVIQLQNSNSHQSIPIILLTSETDPEILNRARQLGVNLVLLKTVGPLVIQKEVTQILDTYDPETN
ncbi:MAG: response regulator, partial [Planctomycetes bacterium]|nr:response regulator [Planctomycetota bacterium]